MAQLVYCTACGNQLSSEAPRCPRCGAPNPAAARAASRGGQVTALIGGILLAVGVFLPWATMGMLSANGLDKTGSEALALVGLGVIGALSAAAALTERGRAASLGPALVGLLGAGLSAYYYALLHEQLDGLADNRFTPSIGFGIYVCILGSLLLLIGGLAALAAHRRASRHRT